MMSGNFYWPQIITTSFIKNLGITATTRKLILFDNEETMFRAYKFHHREHKSMLLRVRTTIVEKLLRTLCIFRRSTIVMLEQLLQQPNPGQFFLSYASQREPLLLHFSHWQNEKIQNFEHDFQERVFTVLAWVHKCKALQSIGYI